MAKPVTHYSRIRVSGDRTITGTLCNRMTGAGDINCTTEAAEVTCKFCLRLRQIEAARETAWQARRCA